MFVKRLMGFFLFASPAFGLATGDSVSVDAIRQAEFLQGEAPATWKPGEVYIIECWATWCGPCIAGIEHLDGLFDQYHAKGLNVLGMDVWEDDQARVVKFVKAKGGGMSYPVAFVGKNGAFLNDWLAAAGVTGIPYAFVVMDGKLLFSTHPAALDEKTIEALLAGGSEAQAVIAKAQESGAKVKAIKDQIQRFTKAFTDGDASAMETALAEVEKIDPSLGQIVGMKIALAATRKDWEGAATMLKALDPQSALGVANSLSRRYDASTDQPSAVLMEAMAVALDDPSLPDPGVNAGRARILWKLGKKEEATQFAAEIYERHPVLPKPPLDAFADSFKKGQPQTIREFNLALRAYAEANPDK